ncbi:MAG: hypothetical protein HUK18_07635 [Bacteroidales bacterium]|nr:hypothetical protein [Bacteroidales bacterium]
MKQPIIIEPTEVEVVIIAINSPMAHFQMAYCLEHYLDTKFYRFRDLGRYKEKLKKEYPHTCSVAGNKVEGLTFYLLTNRTEEDSTQFCFDSMPGRDYFLLIFGRDGQKLCNDLCNEIKKMHKDNNADVVYCIDSDNQMPMQQQQVQTDLFGGVFASPIKPAKQKKGKVKLTDDFVNSIREDVDVYLQRVNEDQDNILKYRE